MGSTMEEPLADLEQRAADRDRELATLHAVARAARQSPGLNSVLRDALDEVLESSPWKPVAYTSSIYKRVRWRRSRRVEPIWPSVRLKYTRVKAWTTRGANR